MMNVFSDQKGVDKLKWSGKPTVVTQAGIVEGAAKNNGIRGAEAIIGTWTLDMTSGEQVIEPGKLVKFTDDLTNDILKSFSVNGYGES